MPADYTHYMFPDWKIVEDYWEIFESRCLKGIVFTQTLWKHLHSSSCQTTYVPYLLVSCMDKVSWRGNWNYLAKKDFANKISPANPYQFNKLHCPQDVDI